MKNLFLNIIAGILFVIPFNVVSAQSTGGSVDLEAVKAVAKNYCLKTDARYSGIKEADLTLTLADTKKSGNIILCYIFNIDYAGNNKPDDGFIIMSACYNSTPVLGYVPDGSYSVERAALNETFMEWLNSFVDEMEQSFKAKAENTTAEALWGSYQSKGAWDSETMLLHLTSQWDQTANFNYYFPATNGGSHPSNSSSYGYRVPVGCVATAMGQILYYYQLPLAGTGSHSYSDPSNPNSNFKCDASDTTYGNFSFISHTSDYDYASMVDKPTSPNLAISKLLYNCAVSVDMDFAYCGSWANTYNVATSLPEYFNYSSNARYIRQSDYTASSWESILIDQIRRERPVQYRGQSSSGYTGHSFVCYGYRNIEGSNQFYFNWGWSGSYDGWFSIPSSSYPLNQLGYDAGAVINIYPTLQPNLKITSASAPDSVYSGTPFTLSLKIKNKGTLSTLSTSITACYLSSDTTLDKTDIYLGAFSTPVIAVGDSTTLSGNITINNEDPGNYYLIINADSAHYVHESVEADNNYHLKIKAKTLGVYDYHSVTTGNWENAGTWEYLYDTVWTAAPAPPNSTCGTITVQNGNTVTINSAVTVNQVVVASGGKVKVNNCSMTIANGAGDDFVVNGTLELTGGSGIIKTTGNLVFSSTGTYIHNRNGGAIPISTWATTSNCNITGITTTAPTISSATQPFGNFTYNCPNQTADYISLAGTLNSIAGNFNVISTGSGTHDLRLGESASGNLVVGGNFSQTGGWFLITSYANRSMTVKKNFNLQSGGGFAGSYSNGAPTLNIESDFSSAGTFYITLENTYNSTGTVNVTGNCYITGGILYLSNPSGGSNSSSIGTLNVSGNFSHTDGTITTSGSGNIVFKGTGVQYYTSGGTVNNTINFTVNNGSYLQMAATSTSITGGGTFTLASGATLGITSGSGITTSGSAGNIQTTSRIFNPGANYVYDGTVNQNIGTGFPANLTGSLTISNSGSSGSNTVTLDITRTISSGGSVNIVNGVFATGTNLSMSSISSVNRSGGYMTGTPQGSGAYSIIYSGNSMATTTELNGAGLNNIAVGLTPGQTLTLDHAIIPDGDLTINSGIFDLSSLSCNRSTSGGMLTVADGATLRLGGNNTMPQNFETHTLGSNSTVEYYGGSQNIYPETSNGYGNLITSGTGTKLIVAGTAVTVNSDLTTNDKLVVLSDSLVSNGSLIVKGSCIGNITYRRDLHTKDNGNYHYFASPVVSNTEVNATKVDSVWSWNEVSGKWAKESGLTGLKSGEGYNLSQLTGSNGEIYFTGTIASSLTINATSPYLNAVDIDVTDYTNRPYADGSGHSGIRRDASGYYGGGGWNLLGNPYTSAIKVSDFIKENNDSIPTLSNFDPSYVAVYIYDGTVLPNGKYYFIGKPDGWGDESLQSYIQAGQGFFVLAMNDTSTFTFTRSMQAHSTSSAMLKSNKPQDPWPGLELKVKLGDNQDVTRVIYNDEMTKGLDPGYDVGQLSSGSAIEIYTNLVTDNGTNFSRQALPPVDFDKTEIPVGIYCDEGGVATFSAKVVPVEHYKFFLEDRSTGIITNLNKDTYTVTLPANTYGTGRFFLSTSYTDRSDGIPEQPKALNLHVWSSGHQIIVEGEVSSDAIITVYDLTGSKVTETKVTDTNYNTVTLPSSAKGLFIVRVKDKYKVLTTKVVIL
jgi:hypothetical protein